MLESSAPPAPERDRPSPRPSPPHSPPPTHALTTHLPLPAACGALEDGEGRAGEGEEEPAPGGQASADSYCKAMGLLGMGHRLFVPKLLAVRGGAWETGSG